MRQGHCDLCGRTALLNVVHLGRICCLSAQQMDSLPEEPWLCAACFDRHVLTVHHRTDRPQSWNRDPDPGLEDGVRALEDG